MTSQTTHPTQTIHTDVPARLDRLPWSRFHVLLVGALGITWVLDGLEVTIIGSIGPALQSHQTLSLSTSEIGASASAYVLGAVIGALFFGWLSDRVGRRAIFGVTLGVYVLGVFASAASTDFHTFALSRILTGLGIGGECAAINSAIDELTPARLRGRVTLAVNSSYWAGAAVGALASLIFIGKVFPPDVGWRLAFAIGGLLGLPIIWLRRVVPESPRWLVTHGRHLEADESMARIERRVRACGHALEPTTRRLAVRPRASYGLAPVLHAMFVTHRRRSILVVILMLSQAFLFNAVFFTYGMVLTNFYHVPAPRVGLHILPLAAGNLIGPFILGPLFDTVGRRRMIAGTYAISAVLLALTAFLFAHGDLGPVSQTLLWVAIFFFASSAACGAYLTASEVFPLETRAVAIAVFYAIGTAAGGMVAPWVFGSLIGTGDAVSVSLGYALAAVLMAAGALAELTMGLDCECQSLEDIAPILSASA